MTDEVKQILREEMDARGLHGNLYRTALAAIIGGESNFTPKFETGYSRTSNSRIRTVFGSRVADLSDSDLTELKASDAVFFNHVYSGRFRVGQQLGNIQPNDGYAYRGGGLLQITGRDNYTRYGNAVGVDLVSHPDLINTPRVAAATAVEYAKNRFAGTTFDALKAAVGVSIGGPDETKNRLFAVYNETGEWYYGRSDVVETFIGNTRAVQKFFKGLRLYSGPIDGDPGPGTRAALKAYLRGS